MVAFGYSLLSEQRGPRDLVADAIAAEHAGFDFAVISDHYFPWLDAQGHSPNAWTVLGAVASATERVPLMTYVTCPIIRYHPAVVAQQAATVALLAGEGRFTLGVGAGENLNEHVVGRSWPPVNIRHVMLAEAIEIIQALFGGGYVDLEGEYLHVDSARLWDLPRERIPIAVAVSGRQSIEIFGPVADAMIATEPDRDLVDSFDGAAGARLPKIGQRPIAWGPDRDEAVARAHEQFRWFGNGWKVNAELPSTAAFAASTRFVRPEDVAAAIPCGPDLSAHVEAVRPFVEAGFTHVALVQVGGPTQPEFLKFAAAELLPALREEYGEPEDPRIRAR